MIWIDGNVCFSCTRSWWGKRREKCLVVRGMLLVISRHESFFFVCFCSSVTLVAKNIRRGGRNTTKKVWCLGTVIAESAASCTCKAESIDLLANKVPRLIHFVTKLIEMEGSCVRNSLLTHVTIAATLWHKCSFCGGRGRGLTEATMVTQSHRHFFVNTA